MSDGDNPNDVQNHPQQPASQEMSPQAFMQPYPQQQRPYSYPLYPPPRKKNTWLLVGIIGAVMAVVVVLLVISWVTNPVTSGLVGKWHFTKIKSSVSTLIVSINIYMEFHGDGTGKSYDAETGETSTFHWSVFNNNLVITDDDTGEENTYTYTIHGTSIQLSEKAYFNGVLGTTTYYGERV